MPLFRTRSRQQQATPRHSVTIMPHTEVPLADRYSNPDAHVMLATLLVRPAIQVGSGFENAVLGTTKHKVSIQFVETARNETALVATSTAALREGRLHDIATIRERVETLSNELGRAALMMVEDPFPRPEDVFVDPDWIPGSAVPDER